MIKAFLPALRGRAIRLAILKIWGPGGNTGQKISVICAAPAIAGMRGQQQQTTHLFPVRKEALDAVWLEGLIDVVERLPI